MDQLISNPAFIAYAVSCLVLCANLLGLWAYSGAVRGGTKTVMNPEDVRVAGAAAAVVGVDPPEVARVLRAHANTMAVFVPFASLGLLHVALGGSFAVAAGVFGFFVFTRLVHSAAYLGELQPWRTVAFVAGLLALLVLLGEVVWLMLR